MSKRCPSALAIDSNGLMFANIDPQKWTEEQLLAWAKIHGVQTTGNETREELLAMVESKMNEPRV